MTAPQRSTTLRLARPPEQQLAARLDDDEKGIATTDTFGGPQQAVNKPRFVHQPADAQTLAHNRAREDEWHAAPAALEALLRDLAPQAFSDCPTPLAVGIDAALIELLTGEFDPSVIAAFLRNWTRRPLYLAALARGDVRIDLNGHPTGAPDVNARRFAAILLGRRGVAP